MCELGLWPNTSLFTFNAQIFFIFYLFYLSGMGAPSQALKHHFELEKQRKDVLGLKIL
jgi:hypothetical protein